MARYTTPNANIEELRRKAKMAYIARFMGSGAYTWTPAELSAVAVWYDPSDLTTMFQDAAGTTAAVVGQPVGKILDKSGNGNHATQSIDLSRPVLRQSGDKYYLEFDGVDDYLTLPLLDLGFNWSVFAGASVDSTAAGDRTIFAQRNTSNNSSIKASLDFSSTSARAYARNDTSTIFDGLAYSIASSTKYVMSSVYTAGAQQLKVNATSRDTGTITLDATTVTHNSIGRAETGIPTSYFDGNLYSLIVRGALSASEEITNAERYVNSKTGAYND